MSAPTGQQGGTVAVGYGGSGAAQLAVRWAAEYAAAAGLDLLVIHAWVWPVFTKNLGPVKGVAGSGLRHSAEAVLAEGIELARGAAREAAAGAPLGAERAVTGQQPERPGPAVDGVMEAGLPAPVLRDASRDARLLVVGSRGLGAVLGQVAGSVCLDLAGSAPCPVMIIRRPRRPGPPRRGGSRRLAPQPRHGGRAPPGWPKSSAPRCTSSTSTIARRGTGRARPPCPAPRPGAARPRHRRGPGPGARAARSPAPCVRAMRPRELLDAADDADVLVIGTHNPAAGAGNTVTPC